MADNPLRSHPGFSRVFSPGKLTLGFMMPLARIENVMPDMTGQLEIASLVDDRGFAALWARDVPFLDPGFGDAGQVYDPWVWLGMLAARTRRIALATAGIVLPLRHPFHTAKASFTLDAVTGGRFMLGAASGDRATEFPAFGKDHGSRGTAYREAADAIRGVAASFPVLSGAFGRVAGLDMLPKPAIGRLPILAVGSAQQSVQWIAAHLDGWMTYPRDLADQGRRMELWKAAVADRADGVFKPFAQPLMIDLAEQPETAPTPIPLGFRSGRNALIRHLRSLEALGVNHVALQLGFNQRPPRETIEELAAEVLPHFPVTVSPAKDHPPSAAGEVSTEAFAGTEL